MRAYNHKAERRWDERKVNGYVRNAVELMFPGEVIVKDAELIGCGNQNRIQNKARRNNANY